MSWEKPCEGGSLPKMVIRVLSGLESSVAARRDSTAGRSGATACGPGQSQTIAQASDNFDNSDMHHYTAY